MTASTPERDDEDSSTNGDCSEEEIFWAAQVLAGNLTLEGDDTMLVGEAILNVFLVVVPTSSDENDERPTKRVKPAEPLNPCWTLEITKARIREFLQLLGQMDDCTTPQNSLRSLIACWLECSENSSGTNSCTVSSKENQHCPFWSLFRNALISMAHLDVANAYMVQSLDTQGNLSCALTAPSSPSGASSLEPTNPELPPIQRHIASALHYWPTNPSALILAANWERMQGTQSSWLMALELYRAAMKCAHITATQLAQPVLRLATTSTTSDDSSPRNKNDGMSSDDKFLVETVLCQSAQQQDKDDDDDNDDDSDNDNGDIGESQVLVTAAYMSALLASCLGQHDVAADSLQHFASAQNPVTRIHPRVWDTGCRRLLPPAHQITAASSPGIPCVFPDAISLDLFQVLRNAFRVDGPYWKESGYSRNIYYSFWTDYPLPHPPVNCSDNGISNDSCCIVGNAVEHYIVAHLLPRVQSVVNSTEGQQVRGFEWWVHTRPHGANIGHQLHFDTDEALLEQDGTVEFPIAATVTYLNLEDDGVPQHGATVLFDQTPYTKANAKTAYISFPKSCSLLVFPGNLLHGVLPCSSSTTDVAEHGTSSPDSSLSGHQRLTFMVNFWGYRIPDRIQKRSLYGPSGPLPPPTPEHTWVHDICQGYPQTIPRPSDSAISAPSNGSGLVAVSPAWDTLGSESSVPYLDELSVSLESPLTLPASSGIQQRFFVTNAPDYFHSTLLEK